MTNYRYGSDMTKRIDLNLSLDETELLLCWFRDCCLIGEKDLEPADYRLAVKIGQVKDRASRTQLEFA